MYSAFSSSSRSLKLHGSIVLALASKWPGHEKLMRVPYCIGRTRTRGKVARICCTERKARSGLSQRSRSRRYRSCTRTRAAFLAREIHRKGIVFCSSLWQTRVQYIHPVGSHECDGVLGKREEEFSRIKALIERARYAVLIFCYFMTFQYTALPSIWQEIGGLSYHRLYFMHYQIPY